MILVSSCICLCTISWSRVLSREWRCSWGSADKRCSNYIWVINNLFAYKGASYIRDLTVSLTQVSKHTAIPQVEVGLNDIITWMTTNVKSNKWNHEPIGREYHQRWWHTHFQVWNHPDRNLDVFLISTCSPNERVNKIGQNVKRQLYLICKITRTLANTRIRKW